MCLMHGSQRAATHIYGKWNKESKKKKSLTIWVIAITVKLFLCIGSKQNIICGTLKDEFLV